MAVSDQLAKLAIRAKQAEEHVAEARAKQKAELEHDVGKSALEPRAWRMQETFAREPYRATNASKVELIGSKQ